MTHKLIFCHYFKTGGSSVRSWFNSKLNIFDTREEIITKPEEIWQRIKHAKIIIFHSEIPIMLWQEKEKWQELVSNSTRLSLVRNPIDRFESHWKYSLKLRRKYMLPYVPNFTKAKPRKDGVIYLSDLSGGYFDQDEESQLNINEFIELDYEKGLGEGLGEYFSYKDKDLENSNSRHFNQDLEKNHRYNYRNLFLKNGQYYNISSHFTKDFIVKPRSKEIDILIPTERLSECFANIILSNQRFAYFTKFDPNKYSKFDLIKILNESSVNKSNVDNSETKEVRITPKNRIIFYLLNKLDFNLWESTYINSFTSYNK